MPRSCAQRPMKYRLSVNGRVHEVDVDQDVPLLWVIREAIGLTGTKFGCGAGLCGACTVHLSGAPTRSCVTPFDAVKASDIITIEGLGGSTDELHPLQKAWIAEQVPQCGYCQSGMIMAAAALLRQKPHPTDDDITQSITNICRCGTYPRIRRAIHRAAASNV